MTTADTVIIAPETTPEERPRTSTRRERLVVFLALGVVALIAAGWFVLAQGTLRSVQVMQDAQPVVCSGAEVTRLESALPGDEPISDPVQLPTVHITEGMECRLRLFVANDSAMTVDLNGIYLPLMGESALRFSVQFANPNPGPVQIDEADVDAVAYLDSVTVAPGQRTLVEVLFTYEGGAMLDQCASMTIGSPAALVSALGADAAVDGGLPITYFMGDPAACGE